MTSEVINLSEYGLKKSSILLGFRVSKAMNKFNDDKFFDGYREQFGPITQNQVNGLSELLACIEDDEAMTDARWIAYALATTYHETAHTFHPIAEYGKGRG